MFRFQVHSVIYNFQTWEFTDPRWVDFATKAAASSTFERESSPLPKSYQAGVPAKKRQPASSHFSKSAMPPYYLLMHFLVCVGWMWFVLQYYYIHTHCCRKVIFVIFIIYYTISCRKTIIRTKSIRLKKCCETFITYWR